jgi:hypothetical protein
VSCLGQRNGPRPSASVVAQPELEIKSGSFHPRSCMAGSIRFDRVADSLRRTLTNRCTPASDGIIQLRCKLLNDSTLPEHERRSSAFTHHRIETSHIMVAHRDPCRSTRSDLRST